MIAGIGIDLVSISRIRSKLEKDSGFRETVFAEAEIKYCEGATNKMQHYAARFAVKEAFLKAMGKGMLQNAHVLKDIEVNHDEYGKPGIKLVGQIDELRKSEHWMAIHVSISHEADTATAIVIIEK